VKPLRRLAAVGAVLLVPAWLSGCAAPPANAPAAPPASAPNPEGNPVPEAPAPTADAAASAERRARVRLELAALYFSRGQTATALEELRQAIAINPQMPEAYSLRGLIEASQGNAGAAEQSLQRALQLAPRDADAMHNYGWFLCQQRRYDEADQQFERAVAIPGYGDASRTLLARGVCLARAGRWVDAERTLSRSYELDPSSPVTAYNLSDVLLRRGELERARFYVRRLNQVPEQVTAQSLWLAARIERRLGNTDGLQDFGRQLRERFPQSPESLQFERGRFDD
jgi:type IV pilus assembly protein PilF